MVKNLPTNEGDSRDTGWWADWEGTLKKEIAIHSSILAWKIPRIEEPGSCSPWGRKTVRRDWARTHTFNGKIFTSEEIFLIAPNLNFYLDQFSSVQSFSLVRLFETPWIAARQASLSITNSRSLLKLMPIESVMPSSHLILWHPLLLLPPIPPSIRIFSNEPTLRMRWPKYRSTSASASVLPMNTQDWSPLGWTGWISLQSKGLSRVFSNTTVQKHQFFIAQLSSQSKSHIHIRPLEKP